MEHSPHRAWHAGIFLGECSRATLLDGQISRHTQSNQAVRVRLKSQVPALRAGGRSLAAPQTFGTAVGDEGAGIILSGLHGLLLVFGLHGETFFPSFKLHADLALVLLQVHGLVKDHRQHHGGKQDADDRCFRKGASFRWQEISPQGFRLIPTVLSFFQLGSEGEKYPGGSTPNIVEMEKILTYHQCIGMHREVTGTHLASQFSRRTFHQRVA